MLQVHRLTGAKIDIFSKSQTFQIKIFHL